jgi:hypothetical protein
LAAISIGQREFEQWNLDVSALRCVPSGSKSRHFKRQASQEFWTRASHIKRWVAGHRELDCDGIAEVVMPHGTVIQRRINPGEPNGQFLFVVQRLNDHSLHAVLRPPQQRPDLLTCGVPKMTPSGANPQRSVCGNAGITVIAPVFP